MSRIVLCLTLAFVLILANHSSFAGGLNDTQIRQRIIQQSVRAYLAIGHPCACTCGLTRQGSPCGVRSAYTRPGGARPICYPSDVNDQMISDWRH
jgi:hypothetical protein